MNMELTLKDVKLLNDLATKWIAELKEIDALMTCNSREYEKGYLNGEHKAKSSCIQDYLNILDKLGAEEVA